MLCRLVLSAVAFALVAGSASAAECVQPYAPVVPSGTTASKEEMLTVQSEVKAFISASDRFQECVLLDIQNQRAALARDQKTLDQSIVDEATRRIAANQREKERVGNEYNATVKAFAAAHPAPAPAPAPAQ